MHEYENTRRIEYEEGAVFVPVCVNCGRFVKTHATIKINDAGLHPGPNADCKKCGPTRMLFEGFI